MDTFKNNYLLIFSLIIIVIVAVYSVANKYQESNLDEYVYWLSEKLIELVPEEERNPALAEARLEFEEKIKKREIAAKELQFLASDILNLSNSRRMLTPAEAESIFNIYVIQPSRPVISKPDTNLPHISDHSWEVVEDKLKRVYEFETKIADSLFQKVPQIEFRVNADLKIIADKKLEELAKSTEMQAFKKELQLLEEQKILLIKPDSILSMQFHKYYSDSIKHHLQKQSDSLRKKLKKIEKNH